MAALAFHSDEQAVACLTTRIHHGEPQLRARRRDDREAAAKRVQEAERNLRECLFGPGFQVGCEL